MSALRLDKVAEEVVCVRVQCCRERRGTCVHRPAEFVWPVRHRQGAFALNGWNAGCEVAFFTAQGVMTRFSRRTSSNNLPFGGSLTGRLASRGRIGSANCEK